MKKLEAKAVAGITLLGVATLIVPTAWTIDVLNGNDPKYTFVPLFVVPAVGLVLMILGLILLAPRVLLVITALLMYPCVIILSYFYSAILSACLYGLDLSQ